MNAEQRAALAKPFPPEKVQQKRGQGGRQMSYISHGLITERLNEVDPEWSMRPYTTFTYTDAGGRLHCEGVEIELTVCGVTRIEAGGPQRQDGFANEIKNAYSDALKRAAMRFGVALSMWESLVDAEYDEDVQPDQTTRPPAKGSTASPVPRPTDRAAAAGEAAASPYGPDLGWTEFWAWAKARGYNGKAEIAKALGKEQATINGWTPAEMRTALEVQRRATAPVPAGFAG